MPRSRLVAISSATFAALLGCGGGGGDGSTSAGAAGSGNLPTPPEVGPESWPCEPGELPMPDGSCQSPGVVACGVGFAPDGEGGCAALLPLQPCTPPLMAIPGDAACREIAPCGSGPWGNIPVEATTVYVDDSYTAPDSDGSASKPWPTIQQGVDAVTSGGIVAIAAGAYPETVLVTGKSARIWGVCPESVSVAGPSTNSAAVRFHQASGSALHTVALTGQRKGVGVWDSTGVVIERTWIHDTAEEGIYVHNYGGTAEVTVRGALINHTVQQGIQIDAGSAVVEETVITDVQPDVDLDFGRALDVDADDQLMTRGSLIVRRSLIHRNRDIAIVGWGSDVVIEDSVVRDTAPRALDDGGGTGVEVRRDALTGFFPVLAVRGSLIDNNHSCGVCALSGDLTVESTTVRATKPRVSDGRNGTGVLAIPYEVPPPAPATLVVVSCLVTGSHLAGIAASGAQALVESTIVRDTRPLAVLSFGGRGIDIERSIDFDIRGGGAVRGVVVEGSYEYGIVAIGTDATVEWAWVRDTRPRADGVAGRGISGEVEFSSSERASLEIRGALVEASTELGIGALGADVLVENSIVRGTVPHPATTAGWGIAAQISTETFAESSIIVRSSLIERNHESGIYVGAAEATVERTWIKDSLPLPGTDEFGDGVAVSPLVYQSTPVGQIYPGTVTIRGSVIENNHRAGLANFAATAAIDGSWLLCNPIHLDGESIPELDFAFEDRGNNVCQCQQTEECKVLSTGMRAPDPIESPAQMSGM